MRLADELGRALGVRPRLRMGGFGALDVVVDGTVIFSKKAEGRIPPTAEIVSRLKGAR